MNALTPEGEQALLNIAHKYNISLDSAISMFHSVNNGGGTMAQFYIPELGSGQWMQGGMTMCGDMFNQGLQAMVSNLCGELSSLMGHTMVLTPLPASSEYNSMSGGSWWPSELGSPSSSGGQNGMQYAYFPSHCRLAINSNGVISLYDTLDHQISGVQQQQGGGSSLSFNSQYGTFSSLSLPLIKDSEINESNLAPAVEPAPSIFPEQSPAPTLIGDSTKTDDIFKNIQQLGDLHQAGLLTEEEFSTKKAELLGRL